MSDNTIKSHVLKTWNGGFIEQISITNNSNKDWTDWSLFLNTHYKIVKTWGDGQLLAGSSHSSENAHSYIIDNLDGKGVVKAGETVTFSFKAEGNPSHSEFSLNASSKSDHKVPTKDTDDTHTSHTSHTPTPDPIEPSKPHDTHTSHTPIPDPIEPSKPSGSALWESDFSKSDWKSDWGIRDKGSFGMDRDIEREYDPLTGKYFLRTFYPKGSSSPSYAEATGAPLGGAQFYADLPGVEPSDALHLSYDIRFSSGFDAAKGGKLPGLFGGTGPTGGDDRDGTDGFTTRFMWRSDDDSDGKPDGEVYAYLPNGDHYGTSIGRGSWEFEVGTWQRIEQEVVLNHVGKNDGIIKVWQNGNLVLDVGGLTFRTTENLKIDGILYSTFYGGHDSSWAPSKDSSIDFANFSVTPLHA